MPKTMSKEEFPTITNEMMKALQLLFPKKMPNLLDLDREIWHSVGVQSVIDLLSEIHKMQNDSVIASDD